LTWAGNPDHLNDRRRSMALSLLAELGTIPGVSLYAIQKGAGAPEAANPPAGLVLENLGPELDSFADTAAALAHLDLLSAVDTSVARLAGALGRPVWVLVPFAPDWRWLLGRDDNPWYPTARLFRQAAPGEWGPVVSRVAAALRELA